jgi:hypothetical protein
MNVLRGARRSLQVVLAALAAHTVAYGSLRPDDPMHGYLGVYEVVVAALSAAALIIFVLALLALLAGRGRAFMTLVGARQAEPPFSRRVGSLACCVLGFLLVQESVERSVENGAVVIASAPALIVFNVIVAVMLASTVLVLVERSCAQLAEALLAPRRELPRPPARVWTPRPIFSFGRRNSLAEFRGLRAPPLAAI